MSGHTKNHTVLFICSANICRSPMAVGLLNKMIQNVDETWRIESAGVYAFTGYPAAENTIQVLEKRGIFLGDHRSRPVSAELIDEFQLILTMENSHKEALQSAYPTLAEKILLFSELVGEKRDIVDPIGRSLIDYEDTAREMESILARGFHKIIELSDSL